MQVVCKTKPKLSVRIRAELSRIDLKCAIIGAVIVLLIGFLSSLAAGSTELYRELERPAGSPPGFIFPIVWTILYALIGAAAGAVFCVCDRALECVKYRGIFFFSVMLVFNFIWSPLFFGAGAYFAAFVDIMLMIALTVITMVYFYRIYFVSAAAMGVYLLWLLYAAYLNLGIIILN